MPDSLPGYVSSMAFTASGEEVWVAHPQYGIEIRSWPEFELQRVLPVMGFFIVGHLHDPYMAVLSHNQAFVLDLEGRIIRSWNIANHILRAAAFLDDALQLLTQEKSMGLALALWSCPLAGGAVERLSSVHQEKSVYAWWAALLPRKRMAFIACNDDVPLLWRIDVGTLTSAREWAPKPERSVTSWLGVDVSSDERFVSWSYKGPEAFIASLDEEGSVSSYVDLWMDRTRIASCAIHHLDDVALVLRIDGKMFSTQANKDAQNNGPWPSFTFAPGYRWG